MIRSKTLIAFSLLGILAANAAQAQDAWTNSAMYNGYGASTQNTPSAFMLRDANHNMAIVDGQFVGSNYSSNSGAQSASSGVGTGGAGGAYGQASAIGNSLNVVTVGSYNTVIVDSTQINNGNQTATVDINSH